MKTEFNLLDFVNCLANQVEDERQILSNRNVEFKLWAYEFEVKHLLFMEGGDR